MRILLASAVSDMLCERHELHLSPLAGRGRPLSGVFAAMAGG
jgi:hypothetical protein